MRLVQLEQLVINVDNLAAWQFQEWGVILWGPGLITEGVWVRYDQVGGKQFIEYLRKQTVQRFAQGGENVPAEQTDELAGLLEPEFIAELGAVPQGAAGASGDDSRLDSGDQIHRTSERRGHRRGR